MKRGRLSIAYESSRTRWGGLLCCWLAVSLVADFPSSARAQAPGGMPEARVNVAVVQQSNPVAQQTFVGTVMPLRTSTVGSSIEGRVIEFAVDEGDAVADGAVLARLRTDQLEIQLAAAEAELQLQEQALQELEQSIPQEIRQAEARMQAATALMKFTELQLKHARTLFQRKAVSEDDVQEKESAAIAAQQKALEYRAALRLATETSPAKIAQAKSRVQAQFEETRRLQDDIAEHTIVAPLDGYVTEEHTEVGQWIAKGGPVVEIVEIHQVDVEVSVPEKYISRVQLGTKARVTIEAMPARDQTLLHGEVTAIVPQADVRSRSFPVKVRLDNRPVNGRTPLMPGMFARVHIDLAFGSAESGLWVPKDAVVLGETSSSVFAVVDGKAQPVAVRLLRHAGDLVEVVGPLKPGGRVVVEGNERLMPGQPLVIVNEGQLPSPSPAAGSKE